MKTVTFQYINLYEFPEVTASVIKYTSILILNCLQELIKNLLNLQITYKKQQIKAIKVL